MELSKNYIPQEAENKWYEHWVNSGYFSSTPNEKPAYTIVIPPPNVTGVLHMGHCLNNTIQDILIRRARMQGFNACWVPGTDHASIATEAKVVQMLREKGITKSSLTREEFLAYAWEWKEKYGGIILQQLRKLGCSMDWDRTSFTMDENYYKAVIKIFVQLYNDGVIYRGLRMVNWDPASKTALSDEEVIFKDIDSKLYYVRYPLVMSDNGGQMTGNTNNQNPTSDNSIMVATTRPETILGDVAICVNPDDARYKDWVGKEVIVPIINRKIKIIADEYVDAAFGTGALKITPAHDKNDNEIGRKHNLKSIDTLDADGKFTAAQLEEELMNDLVKSYNGIDRFDLRKKIVEDISALGQIEKIEDYKGQVGTSERTGAVIESRLSMQWFMDMKTFLGKHPETLSAVLNDEIKFHPAKLKNTYNHWLENIKDWCISRQLWWGQQIPAWYDDEGNFVVAETLSEAQQKISDVRRQMPGATDIRQQPSDIILTQDEDCLDTWFSSWLWPMEVFKGISNPNNEEVNYYYPTTTLVTGQDIIFFWVARMIMAGFEFKQQIPFKDVYFTGMVRDKQGRKMSKQLGNSPDLLGLIDQFGADAVRFGIMIASPAGNDLLFDESGLEQGKMFGNKIWNAMKLLHILNEKEKIVDDSKEAIYPSLWFEARLAEVQNLIEQDCKEFKLSEALKKVYSLIWDDFCSWYLEWIKPAQDQPINQYNIEKALFFFEELMKILHPFMPFITEEVYHSLKERKEGDDITISEMSDASCQMSDAGNIILKQGESLQKMITAIRDVRVKQNLKPKDEIELQLPIAYQNELTAILKTLQKQSFAKTVSFVSEPVEKSISFMVDKMQCSFTTEKEIDNSAQKVQLEKDLVYYQGFLQSVDKKLSNEKFVANAKPEIIEMETKKKNDAIEKLRIIQESLNLL
jgi:valyl-tRNA synthetase